MPAFSICNGDLFYSPLPPSIAARLGVFARLLVEPEARCTAPGELGERRSGREAQGGFGSSGRPFLRPFLLAEQKKGPARGAETGAFQRNKTCAERTQKISQLAKKQDLISPLA